jgi:hypothetical protein
VLDFRARQTRDALRIEITARANLDAERYELERQARRLETVLKLRLDVR